MLSGRTSTDIDADQSGTETDRHGHGGAWLLARELTCQCIADRGFTVRQRDEEFNSHVGTPAPLNPPAPGRSRLRTAQRHNGTNGVNGKDGVTTVIHDRGKLTGNTVRTLHARKIQGKKFLSVRASLRGKRLNVHGRTVKVDLRGKTVGNYNVVMVAKYKSKSTGKIHTERTIRSLSIFRK